MIGVLCISHGILADAMKETAEIFFGNNIENFESLGLSVSETAESYRDKLMAKVEEMDKGEGVIILADLLGGTPCNQCAFLDHSRVKVIAGMNLPMVMECLAMRNEQINTEEFSMTIRNSIVDFSKVLKEKRERKQRK